MNTRVLELIKNPQTIQVEDLKTLETEIHQFPYIQNIRALYLYGVHLFDVDNYQKELSKTAAYTTDKKVLYQLINQAHKTETPTIETEAMPLLPQEEKETPMEEQEPQEECGINPQAETLRVEVIDAVYGVRNRILFEGEENFWKEATTSKEDIYDVEASENTSHNLLSENEIAQQNVSEIPETKKEPLPIKATPESTEDHASELSFHGVDTFLPDIHIPVEHKAETYQPKPTLNKHEEEMKRLVAEVEAKIKAKKEAQKQLQKEEKHEEEDTHNGEINFAETQHFIVTETEATKQDNSTEIQRPSEIKEEESFSAQPSAQNTAWKPMALEQNQPDALLGKAQSIEKTTPQQPTTSEPEEKKETPQDERPVFNVSFFTSDTVTKIEEEVLEESEDSNVPMFINTWQKWLKIDRNESTETKTSEEEAPTEVANESTEKETEILASTIEEIKEKAIEDFIENEPKISKLKKEETHFVAKEKTDDISHLMTETLANLYVEQRLYTKAIEAYQVLQEKYPEKTEVYAAIIEDINQQKNSHRF